MWIFACRVPNLGWGCGGWLTGMLGARGTLVGSIGALPRPPTSAKHSVLIRTLSLQWLTGGSDARAVGESRKG